MVWKSILLVILFNFLKSKLDILQVDVVFNHILNAFAQRLDLDLLQFTSGHVFDLVE